MTNDPTEQQLLDLLQPNEVLSGNQVLSILRWDKEVFEAVKQRLKAKGLVALGRGRGSSISLVAVASSPARTGQEAKMPESQKAKKPIASKATTEAPIENQLWKTADKLRKNIDSAEYMHIGLPTRTATTASNCGSVKR